MRAALVALALWGVAGAAAAHETALYPALFTIDAGQPLTLALSSMETFPTFETGPRPERVHSATASIANTRQPLTLAGHEPRALRFSVTARRRGALVAAVDLGPRDIDLAPDKVAEYFAEIDPPAVTRASLPEGATLHETYTKYAKAIVCVATCGAARQAARPLGHTLEFVAVLDGDAASLRRFALLARGAPAADIAVTIWSSDAHTIVRTGADGAFTLPADVHGPAMLSATILRPPATPDARFASDFATLTLNAP